MDIGILLLAAFVFGYAMTADKLDKTPFTAPMLFLGFGLLISRTGFIPGDHATEILHFVAEVTLIVLLFLDAAKTDLRALRTHHVWPMRMLLLGVPLSIIIGALMILPVLPDWPVFAVILMATILAPTDAALGQAVVTNAEVPERERRTLTVESGMNDGLALPAVLLFASLTADVSGDQGVNWLVFGAKQLILGPLVGVLVGTVAGTIMIAAKNRNLTSQTFEGVGTLAVAAVCYLLADAIGGNGFISTFVGGLLFGSVMKGHCKFVYEFADTEGKGLSWLAFFAIGLVLVPEALPYLDARVLIIIAISLFLVRPLAVWISLIGTDASSRTRLFFGWFGPRGLATALFALLIVDKIDHEFAQPILFLAVNAVWISAVLHGITALPGARWYAKNRAR
ncbi:sodium:potassium antiporter [Ruegeria sp. ANG-R]|uniref:cation:proton antiporter n=1 Tax=Ruegeria sp. ANG-R TaxID=1577903 RepID=UPI00057F61AB|nr:cation:proton antiporter [Ruegeria sp. ANG-R]KIC39042.1 sodium:potassium antiporter [Ruegeria sp. ANG-R]